VVFGQRDRGLTRPPWGQSRRRRRHREAPSAAAIQRPKPKGSCGERDRSGTIRREGAAAKAATFREAIAAERRRIPP
jgi:hypothetical protein